MKVQPSAEESLAVEVDDIAVQFSEYVPSHNPIEVNQAFPRLGRSESAPEDSCKTHVQDFILFCLKCQEKICTKCLDTNHLLHPVVPLNSVNKLDFKKSLQKEIEKSLEDIKARETGVHAKLGRDLKQHKIALRNYIIHVRDSLRQDFDNFFNNMLSCIRADWNLFDMQEVISTETSKFSSDTLEKLS